MKLVDELGFDAVDAGGLDDSWRQQPGTPVYVSDHDADGVARTTDRGAYQFTTGTPPPPTSSACDVNKDNVTNVVDPLGGVPHGLGQFVLVHARLVERVPAPAVR